jgi:peptidoglycan hydrolase-like protein with peptidoglycan-binding domain
MLPGFDPNQITNLDGARQAITLLLNLVEEFKQENDSLRHEVQQLRDEINRLKGEQGKPNIKAGKKGKPIGNISSEPERRQARPHHKSSKLNKIEVNREEKLLVDRCQLPTDAQFKGYEPIVIQDIEFKTNNVRFLKEKFYSPSQKKSYLATLPVGYEGEFGPGVRSLIITLYYGSEMTEPKIVEFLQDVGIFISEGQVSNLLTKKNESWHQEKNDIYLTGLASSSWQHSDDTSTRVNGNNHYCHVVCNPLYTAYFTRPNKDRLTIISILQNVTEPLFLLNETTPVWLAQFDTPDWAQKIIATWPQGQQLSQSELITRVQAHLARLNTQQQARVMEAAALTAYYQQTDAPIVSNLLTDDAPQFRFITRDHSLCWVHDGRHYKKLTPFVEYNQHLLADFRRQFWDYYHKLNAYRVVPTPEQATQLDKEFDELFSRITGYEELDKRIAKTMAKKDRLLKVLSYPEMPLHNNPAELAARRRVRKRDISFGPRTADGVAAWDTFMTLAATSRQLGVSFYAYIYDRMTGAYTLPNLVDLIQQLAPAFHPLPTGVFG